QIFAKVLQALVTEEALLARGGVGSDDPVADREPRDTLADGDDITCQFVPEHGRGHDHAGMVAAPEHLDVGAAGESYLDSYEDVSAINCRNGYRLDLQVFLAVKHGGHHLTIHL